MTRPGNPRGADAPAPPAGVDRELYLEWRSPRRGRANPEPMTNPVWAWLVDSRLSADRAGRVFDAPSVLGAGPGWCFDRFGRSTTELADGRTLFVAGEHEDYYDPDFYIYNDVVVRHPDGRVDIFGYPPEVFPPTDFHSATLAGDRIVLIGSLGYGGERRPGSTQVLSLDLATFAVRAVETSGDLPGWVHKHRAALEDGGRSIVLQGGLVDRGGDEPLVENIDDWRLDLDQGRWTRLTERRWQRWLARRSDRARNHFWEFEQACWSRSMGRQEKLATQLEALTRELRAAPDLDAWGRLFRPSLPHEVLPDDDDSYGTVRLVVGGLLVRFVYGMFSLQVTVEGELPRATADALVNELVDKLGALEHTPWEAIPL